MLTLRSISVSGWLAAAFSYLLTYGNGLFDVRHDDSKVAAEAADGRARDSAPKGKMAAPAESRMRVSRQCR